MIAKLKLTITPELSGHRLDDILCDWLAKKLQRPVSKAKARKLIMAGAIRLDGRPVRIASLTVPSRTTIEAAIDIEKLFNDATSKDKAFELTPARILFEDDDLIAIDKPSGLPSHPTVDQARDNLSAAITRFLAKRDRNAKPYLGIHQRLDRDTSGVVLFTKTQRVNAAVGEIFANHLATKIYQALTVVRPNLKQEWTIKNHLGPKYAETHFRIIETYARGTWIEAIPKTGRTHQIRVHLSEYGLPILGDDLYDGGPAPRLMLHAAQLIFPHPLTKQTVSVKSPLPPDFDACLRQLKS